MWYLLNAQAVPIKCSDCLYELREGMEGCQHVPVRGDEATGNTYYYANQVNPCYCQCGVSMARAALGRRDIYGAQTLPLSLIRRELGILNPEGWTEEATYRCECGRHAPESDRISAVNQYGENVTLCSACISSSYGTCAHCEARQHNSWMSAYPMLGQEGRTYICTNCLGGEYAVQGCEHCGFYQYEEDWTECCEPDEDGIVEECQCYECRRATTALIRSYSFRPIPVFAKVDAEGNTVRQSEADPKTVYMGFELEVNTAYDRNPVAQRLLKATGKRVYLKEDSSIGTGFEIVTHPATLDWYMANFPWQTIRDMRSDGSMTAGPSCGLHVHVSRSAFSSASHQYRWFLFFYRNQQIMNLLAGRESHWAEFNPTQRSLFKEIAQGAHPGTQRYAAINTNPSETFEVRLFASTLYVNRLKSALQLVESTVEYTRSLASSKVLKDGGFSFDSYMAWLLSHGRRYQDLYRRIEALTGTATIGRVTTHTDSWHSRDRSGRTRYTDRTIVTQEMKTGAVL